MLPVRGDFSDGLMRAGATSSCSRRKDAEVTERFWEGRDAKNLEKKACFVKQNFLVQEMFLYP